MRTPAVPLLALGLITVALLSPPAASALVQISTDTFINPDSQHATQVEPDTFAFGSTVVAAFQSGRFFDGGASGIGFATSKDGGRTWVNGFLPALTVNSTPPGPYDRASDPTVAYDAAHDVWMITSLAITARGSSVLGAAVVVSRSVDGGLTWGAPVVVSAAGRFSNYDKEWTACDNWLASPNFGSCYTTWDDAGLGDRLLMSTSSDGGATWGPKKSPRLNATGLGGIPLPQPNGHVVVPALDASGTAIIAFRSGDGGGTWSVARTISAVTEHNVAGNLRVSGSLPSADVDAAGKLYVVWSDCRFRASCSSNDLVMSTSNDGIIWTSVVRIPIDPTISGVDHFLPGVAVDRTTSGATARLSLTYYYYPNATCTQDTCQLFVGFVASADSGATWTAPRTVAGPVSLNSLADTSQGLMVGDYISTSIVDSGEAVPVFALAAPPVGSLLDEAMFAEVIAPTSAAVAQPLRVDAREPVLSTQSDKPVPAQPLVIR